MIDSPNLLYSTVLKMLIFTFLTKLQLHNLTRNSSGDEIANFLYDDIVHVLQNTRA